MRSNDLGSWISQWGRLGRCSRSEFEGRRRTYHSIGLCWEQSQLVVASRGSRSGFRCCRRSCRNIGSHFPAVVETHYSTSGSGRCTQLIHSIARWAKLAVGLRRSRFGSDCCRRSFRSIYCYRRVLAEAGRWIGCSTWGTAGCRVVFRSSRSGDWILELVEWIVCLRNRYGWLHWRFDRRRLGMQVLMQLHHRLLPGWSEEAKGRNGNFSLLLISSRYANWRTKDWNSFKFACKL